MHEVFKHLDHVGAWRAALAGQPPDWQAFFRDYKAAVDWPASAFWRELSAAFPEAKVVLSARSDPQAWWDSAHATVLPTAWKDQPPELEEWRDMLHLVLETRFSTDWTDPPRAMAAYETHTAAVRAAIPPERLLEWRAEDGWLPLCNLLSLPVPNKPFPHLNSRNEW